MKSTLFGKTLDSAGDSCKNFDFDKFLGQFESHKDELIEREKAISRFLNNRDDPSRQST